MNQLTPRSLGQTDIEITPIGLGVMQFAGGAGILRFVYSGVSSSDMDAIIEAALNGGINWFDTAEFYGKGRSEAGLARGLHAAGKNDEDVVIATKWWPLLRTSRNIPKTIDERLHYLDGYSIDLYQIHWPWGLSSIDAQLNAMADLIKAGKIRSAGVSNFSAQQMRKAQAALAGRGLPLASNQVHYSLLARDIESNGVLDTARELGVTIISYSPLESGILSGKFHKDPELLQTLPRGRRMSIGKMIDKTRPLIDTLDEIAGAHEVSISQVALNWLVTYQGDTVVAIPGASKPRHARESAGAMRFTLSQEESQRIDAVSRQIG